MSSYPPSVPGAQDNLGHKDKVNNDVLDTIHPTETITFSCTGMFISTSIRGTVLSAGNKTVQDTGLTEERSLSIRHK